MPRRKKPDPSRGGWEREAFDEDIDSQVNQTVNAKVRNHYRQTYRAVQKLKEEGKTDAEIREKMKPNIVPRKEEATDSWAITKQKRVSNEVEQQLDQIASQAVEDALAGIDPRHK